MSTTSYTSSDFATPTLVVDAKPDPEITAKSNRPTMIGVAVGVPIGLVGIALLLYVLRWYLQYRKSCTATVYFPPDPINPFADRIIPKIELDALPNAIHELDGTTAPSELGNSTSAVVGPKRPSSIVSELEGSPVTPSDQINRASMAMTRNQNRWSNVSSLAPSQAHRAMAARPSIAESLSTVSQQHHGSGQDAFLTPPRPHASHRLSRPTSGLLPKVGVADDEIHSTPKPDTAVETKQERNDIKEQHEGEQAVAVQQTHEDEQICITETVHVSGEAAQASESSHEGETADEGEVLCKSGTDAQAGEVMQASEITSEVEAARKSEDSQQSDVKLQSAQDMQSGEKQHEVRENYEGDTQAQSDK